MMGFFMYNLEKQLYRVFHMDMMDFSMFDIWLQPWSFKKYKFPYGTLLYTMILVGNFEFCAAIYSS